MDLHSPSSRTGFAGFVDRTLERLVALQVARPVLVLAFAVLTLVPACFLASKLKVRSGFAELLPDSMPSVVELRRIEGRLPSASTLAVTAESTDPAALERFVAGIAPKLRGLPPDLVSSVEEGPGEAKRFFESRAALYAKFDDLKSLRDDIVQRYDWEISRRIGTAIDEDDEPPKVDAETIRKRFQDSAKGEKGLDLGNYYIGEDGKLAVILVRSPLRSMDQKTFDLKTKIERLVEEGGYAKQIPGFHLGFTGNLVTSAEEYRSVIEDLTSVGITGGCLVLAVVFLFFWRLRAMLALGVAITVGCLWCFAFAQVSVGHLNTASGFLVSLIAGNGINAMVIYMARFIEARRDQRLPLDGAVRTASLDTWEGTLAAVGVAMVSYGALMTTDFRGFRHFGIIGAAGMLSCWIATYTVLPAVLVVADRLKPFSVGRTTRDRLSGLYARPFIWLARRFPAPIAALGLVSAVVTLAATVSYFAKDPMEYDMRRVRNDKTQTSASELSDRIGPIVGRLSQAGRALLVERLDQVEPLVAELERRRDAAPTESKPFGQVASIRSVLPKDQERKLPLLAEIRDRLNRAHKRGFVDDASYEDAKRLIPDRLEPVTVADLPPIVAAPFRERDGTVGKIVYVAPAAGHSINDARYLIRWADSFREVKLPNGDVIRGTGDPVVFADMLLSIAGAAPRIALLSVLGTAGVILLAFRGGRSGFVALGTLCLGICWLVAGLAAFGVKLNFLNFVALPIAIGVGSDYAINVMKRWEIEGDEGIERAFTETGGAVVACSLTTLSGYASLLFSINGAVRSMGITAGLGELATQFSAMLVLPAVLYLVARRRAKARVPVTAEPITGA